MAEQTKTFDVIFEGTGTASGKMRNDIHVTWPMMKESFDLATDEGPFHGGDGTAPPPLALFTAALTGCLMTQIRAFAKRLKIDIGEVKVNARLHWKGDVDLDSGATPEDQARLLDAARKGCFIETTLAQGLTVGHRLRIGEAWQEA